MRLANKVVCITGTGTGSGKVSAILFAKEGAKVMAVANTHLKEAEELAENIRKNGGEATAIKVDVSQEEQVAQMIQKTVDTYGRIDVLYNNAGVGFSSSWVMAPTVETPLKDWDGILGINLRSVFLGCKYALPVMEKQGGGVIINTATVASMGGRIHGCDAYVASKGGVISLTRTLAVDYAPKIRVNCISPGLIDTPMIAPAVQNPDILNWIISNTPMGRLGTSEDIAYTALFLASDESAFITGVILPVDGGWAAK